MSDELEMLEAIYPDVIQSRNTERDTIIIELLLNPKTGLDSTQHYVRAMLEVTLDKDYPESSPMCRLADTRGLTDQMCLAIMDAIAMEASQLAGECCCYQLSELASDALTEANYKGAIFLLAKS